MTTALRRHAVPVAALVLAGVALFGRVASYRFVQYDDYELLGAHHAEIATLANPVRAFTTDAFAMLSPIAAGVYFRPFLVWSYGTESRLFGPNPSVFHATNVALHLLATGFVYALLATFGAGRGLATGLALIFACHPGSALVAAWIPCRNESMLAIACIASTLALVRFLREGRPGALALCVAAYVVALFTKESGAVLLAVLACAALIERTGRAGELRTLALASTAAVAAAVGWAALRHLVLGRSPIGASAAIGNVDELVVYLGKLLFPIGLAAVPHPADTALWPGVLALAVLALATLAARDRLRGPAGLGLVWCAAFLVPAAAVPPQTWGLEHRIYLPLVGLLLFVSQCAPPARVRAPEWLGGALAVAVAIVFAVFTARRLPDFAAPIPYWESAARTAPHSAFAASRVAWRYYEAGRFADVPDAAGRALEIDGSRADVYLVRGLGYFQRSDLTRAEPDLLRSVELDPENAHAWAGLARVQRALGREAESQESRRRARALLERRSTAD